MIEFFKLRMCVPTWLATILWLIFLGTLGTAIWGIVNYVRGIKPLAPKCPSCPNSAGANNMLQSSGTFKISPA